MTRLSGNIQLASSAPEYTSANGTETSQDVASNNLQTVTWTSGFWSSAWMQGFTGSSVSYWSGQYKVSQGQTVQADSTLHWINTTDTPAQAYQCVILDTKHVTYESDRTLFWGTKADVPGIVTYYYTGSGVDGIVDPSSPNYDPNQFRCGSYATSEWTTEAPDDLSQVKAVLVSYPWTDEVGGQRVVLRVEQTIDKGIAASDLPTDVWTWKDYGRTDSESSVNWADGSWLHGNLRSSNPTNADTRRSLNPADKPGEGILVSSLPSPFVDARYPFTGVGRDLLWVVGAAPTVSKVATPASLVPGQNVSFTIKYAAEGDATATPTRDGYTLVDTMPVGLTYVAGSSSAGEPTITVVGDAQVLTWVFDGLPVNETRTLTFDAASAGDLVSGTSLVNRVSASVDGVTRSSSATVRIARSGLTRVVKASDLSYIPNVNGDGSGEASWTVTVSSEDPVTNAFTDTIDVLPYNGDGRGSDFAGTYKLSGPVIAPVGATVYYSTANPSSISTDAASSSNGSAGDVSGNTVGWSTTFDENATAVRVIGGLLAPSQALSFTIPYVTDAMDSGDVLVNLAEARAERTKLLMRTSAEVSVATYYSVSIKKYVLADPSDPESWVDANDVAEYPTYGLGEDVRYRVVVTNTGAGVVSNVVVGDDLQPDLGSFWIDELTPGVSQSHEYTVSYTEEDPATIVNTACVIAADPGPSAPEYPERPFPYSVISEGPEDPNEVSLSCDPAGVLIPNHPDVQVEKASDPVSGSMVAVGDDVVYSVTFTNAGNVEALVDYTDYLAGVLDDADIDVESIKLIGDDTEAIGFVWDETAQTINVKGYIAAGDTITLSYTVTVTDTADGDRVLLNFVTPGGQEPPEECEPDDPLCTEHPVPGVPGFELTKVADPVSGTQVRAGDTITYTVTGLNTGDTVLDPVTISDDLADVLDNASLVEGSLSASVGDAPVLDDTTWSWSGRLAVGESVVITYSVIVDQGQGGELVHNVASGSATPIVPDPEDPEGPGVPGEPITPPEVETEHPVPGVPTPSVPKTGVVGASPLFALMLLGTGGAVAVVGIRRRD